MLQEMGITVWNAPQSGTAALAAPPAQVAPMAPLAPTAPPSTQRATAPVAPAAAPVRAAAPAPTPAAHPPAGGPQLPLLRLHPAQPLYPQADPAQTPAELGQGWLIVTESISPTSLLASDAGRLLDNMLRAMQLHRHPRVYLAALSRPAPGTEGAEAQAGTTSIAADLADMVERLQPALVLVLGHMAARAALGSTEPLGRLRARPHQLGHCPAIVTYDPALLLRAQPETQADGKAATWADLCRALATVRQRAAPTDSAGSADSTPSADA